jgi:phage terminase large subunit-like protein
MATRTRSPKSPGLPSEAELKRLKLSPEVAWYLIDRGIGLPDCPPKIKTPEPRTVRGAKFDPERVDKVLLAFSMLRHTQGKWAGRPLKPDPWQVAYILAPVFGWVRFSKDAGRWVRIISSLYVDVPRKNGKTTLVGGISIYLTCADGEQGAQVVCAATTKDQARFLFAPVKTLAEKSPALKPHVKTFTNKIVHPASGSYFEPVSSVAEAQHGANLHAFAVDELHIHKTPDMVETLETGTGSRDQPLGVIITTADDGRPETIYARKRQMIESLAKGTIKDPSTYGVVWAADATDDPFSIESQRKANPGFGISPTAAYLERASKKAQNSPAELSAYLRLHLGIRTKQQTKFLNLPDWDSAAGLVDEASLAGRSCFGGLDLASVSDVTALCWLFPADEGFDALWRFWIPEAALDAMDKRTAGAASVWVREGWLTTTPGNVTDYDFVRATINTDRERFDVQRVAYDRWGSSKLVNELVEDGVPLLPVGQGFRDMTAPMKEIQRLVLGSTTRKPLLRHGGNPVMRWMVDNLAVRTDPSGNVKPDKDRSGDKIDGVSALADAMHAALAVEAEPTYESAVFV